MTKKQLIEDYQKKVEMLNNMINKEAPSMEDETLKRYITKRSCYRTFITELERLEE